MWVIFELCDMFEDVKQKDVLLLGARGRAQGPGAVLSMGKEAEVLSRYLPMYTG